MRTLWIGIWLCLIGCRDPADPPSLSDPSGYPAPVAKILLRRCAGCHSSNTSSASPPHEHGTNPSGGVLPSTRLNLSRWDSLFYGYSGEVAPVVPGNPDWSHLLWQVNWDSTLGPSAEPLMPPPLPDRSNLLTAEEISLLRQWIQEGARNAKGEMPWAHRTLSTRRKSFICAAGSDLIAVLDADRYYLMHYIPVGINPGAVESPHYIQLSPDGRYLYVTLIAGAAVEKYRTDTYEKVGRVSIAPDPAHIELSSDGRYAVVTHFTTTAPVKLSLIDTEEMRVIDELRDPTGQIIARPHGLWVTPDFRYAYVTANSGNYITKVEIAPDRSRFIDFTQIPLTPNALPQTDNRWGPYQILAEPSGRYYFVSCDVANEVRVFSQGNDSLVAVLPTAAAPKLMAYHEGLLYVACLKASAPSLQGNKLGAIALIDVQTLRVLTHVFNLGHLPRGIGVDPLQNQLFVSYENTAGGDPPHHYVGGLPGAPGKVYILQLPTLQLRAVREIALAGYGLAISP
ncbi:MAG: beta-propeller fold lactonase family protein [Bacteroidia bacterium]|nr:beta-propeller fold lactonase family protein [Bacteroidia bacterium]